MATSEVSQQTASINRLLLWCGAVAGPLFIAMFLLEGASAAHYNPLRHPVSSLALRYRPSSHRRDAWTAPCRYVTI